MDFDIDISYLSSDFTKDYPHEDYPELMLKEGRPYACLLIDVHEEFLICIPFRSSISHNNAYLFTESERSKRSRSGLDFSKIILIQTSCYIDSQTATVDPDEYKETIRNVEKIVEKICKYIDGYVKHIKGEIELHPREFERRYRHTTLKYFHDILGINDIHNI